MKIRVLDTGSMGTVARLADGDIVKVEECGSNLLQVGGLYIFGKEWEGKYFEIVENEPVNKLTTNHYVDVQGWSKCKIKRAAEMFSQYTGLPIYDTDCFGRYHYMVVSVDNDIMVASDLRIESESLVEISQENFNRLLGE